MVLHINAQLYTYTHTHIYIYIYIYICVCVCVFMCNNLNSINFDMYVCMYVCFFSGLVFFQVSEDKCFC